MSQISKDTASKMALQLTDKKKEVVDAIYKEFQEFLFAAYTATVPKAITGAFKKHREYFYSVKVLDVKMDGNYNRSFTLLQPIISNQGGYRPQLHDGKATEQARLLLAKHEKAEAEYKRFLSEVEAALLTLKTPKRIVEQFPEAAPFLPTPPTHAIVVNLDKIRKEVQKPQ